MKESERGSVNCMMVPADRMVVALHTQEAPSRTRWRGFSRIQPRNGCGPSKKYRGGSNDH